MCGTNNKGLQRRLLLEPGLTFDKAIEMALAAEAADKDLRCLTGATTDKDHPTADQAPPAPQTAVHNVGQRKQDDPRQQSKQQGSSYSAKLQCYRCGGKHHPSMLLQGVCVSLLQKEGSFG